MDIYESVTSKAAEIEAELKRLERWRENPLPDECFDNIGAFGSNTMSFENWLQFILIPRIHEIIKEKSDFPSGSHLAPYAIRYFDGDADSELIQDILYALDQLINNRQSPGNHKEYEASSTQPPTVSIDDTTIPTVLFSIAEVLPQFGLNDLESQLQTFDTFLGILSPGLRPSISNMLQKAADQTTDPDCKKRIEQAAQAVADGRRAAALYDHDAAMKKYQDEHRNTFPDKS